ncbi:sulfatase-like hydrolase/transferase [Patescibacteria group bacterium]
MKMKWKKQAILTRISPLIIAFSSLVFLYAENVDRVPLYQVVRSILATILFVFFVQIILLVLIKSRVRAAFTTGIILFVCFFYGHFTTYIPHFELIRLQTFVVGKNTFLVAIVLIFFFIFVFWARKTKRKCVNGLFFISTLAIIMISMNLFRIGKHWVRIKLSNPSMHKHESIELKGKLNYLPDIYYIILDMHARGDVLEDVYGYKDDFFIPKLTEMGFFVASESSANYPTTYESIASSLNLNYLDEIIGTNQPTTSTVISLVEENQTAKNLKKLGYTYVLFKSGYAIVDKSPLAGYTIEYSLGLNRFEKLFINTTIFSQVIERMNADINTFHRQRVLYFFQQLKKIPDDKGPTFTFAHFVTPHWPFVFDASGNPVSTKSYNGKYDYPKSKKEYQRKYLDQLVFTDKQILEVVSGIIKFSDNPPIIIIQSDHGPSSEIDWENFDKLSESETNYNPKSEISKIERIGILNAYYFPDNNYQNIYSAITPVNTFRVVFNQFFGSSYKLVEDMTVESE